MDLCICYGLLKPLQPWLYCFISTRCWRFIPEQEQLNSNSGLFQTSPKVLEVENPCPTEENRHDGGMGFQVRAQPILLPRRKKYIGKEMAEPAGFPEKMELIPFFSIIIERTGRKKMHGTIIPSRPLSSGPHSYIGSSFIYTSLRSAGKHLRGNNNSVLLKHNLFSLCAVCGTMVCLTHTLIHSFTHN